MNLRFDYLPYRRNFINPLATAHGSWQVREGIIIRLEDVDGQVGFGEVAPLPWFGTESFEEALRWCEAQEQVLVHGTLDPGWPCCAFAVGSALYQLEGESLWKKFSVAALLKPSDRIAEYQNRGYRTFKVKLGVNPRDIEMNRVEAWCSKLDAGEWLRLDANGGFSEQDFAAWLEFLEGKPVEFLEQPLAVGLENRMLEMAEPFSTVIALDESVSGRASLSRWSSWPGRLVVKPSLLGDTSGDVPAGIVGSSVFETSFGYEAALQFLARHQDSDTALGFGTPGYFEDDGWSLHKQGPELCAGEVTVAQLQALWEEKS